MGDGAVTARILTIHRATVEIDGKLYSFVRKTRSHAATSPSGVEPVDVVELARDASAGRN